MNDLVTSPESLDTLLKNDSGLNNLATLQGISDLVGKLAPLLQGQRLHNLVDLASAVSDVVDMADDAMVQKLMKGYEGVAAGAFNITNAMNYASAQAGAEKEPPTVWQALRRLNRDEDARRGLSVAMSMLALLGQQAREGAAVLPED